MKSISETIIAETRKIIEEKEEKSPDITSSTHFMRDLPMDSLDLATLVVTMEMLTGTDPFREGFKTFHTVEELTALYEAQIV